MDQSVKSVSSVVEDDFKRRTTIKVVSKSSRIDRSRLEYAPGYVFTKDPDCRDYDWLVAYDDLRHPEPLACPAAHTILATSEPLSIKRYSRSFTRQFAYLLTNRPFEAERHPGYRLGRGYYRWYCDRTYAEAVATGLPPKTDVVSAVCSSKRMRHTKHFARWRLLSTLAREVPELAWYGRGVRSFGKKYAVMDPYKYNIVVENHIAPHHWTEKLTDAYLSGCLPFYAGAPDLADDFPSDSFIPIPIDDPDEAVRIVRTSIGNGEYERRASAVAAARRLVLEKYNFYAQVIDVIESGASPHVPSVSVVYSRKGLRRRSVRATVEDAVGHVRLLLKV